MITKYLTTFTTTFNPLCPLRAHKTPRILLSFLPSSNPAGLKINTTVLPQNSSEPSSIILGFKDGKTLVFRETVTSRKSEKGSEVAADGGKEDGVFDLGKLGIKDVVEEVDRHSRFLRRKEELSGT